MEKKSKFLTLIIALCFTLVVAVGTLVAVIVSGNQTATSNVKVQYTSSDVWVRMEANYYVGSTATPLKDGSNTSIELSPINTTGSLNQVEEVVNITKENPKIVYEYIFTNLSDTIPAVISQTMVDSAVMVPTDTYNNVTLKYIASSTQLGANASATSETLNSQALNPSATQYVYVIVEIKNLLYDVLFEGEFGWTLTKGTAVTTSTTNSSGNKIINVNTSETGLTNATELNSIQLVLDVENQEPEVYPLVLNKAFTGWYYDSSLTNKVEWPIVVTETTTLYPKTETATSGLTYSYSSGSYSVTGYSGSVTAIIIPDVYNDGTNGQAKVTKIANNAFKNKTAITSVIIPNSVTSIGNYAFQSCSNLTSLVIQNGVTSIGSSVFRNCSSLTSLTIGSGVTSIGSSAFYKCSSLTNITVNNGNIKYDSRNNCNAIIETSTNTLIAGCKNTAIPSSVTSIGNYAFQNCSGLTSITIPNSVTSIGNYAFQDCGSLTSITIPNSVTSIGSSVFRDCSGLTSVTIPNSVTSIGNYAFQDCGSLTSITIPNSVTSIGSFAFSGCTGLTSITIPNSVTSISSYAFDGCSKLSSITIPNGVTSIGDHAFSGCTGLTSITIPNSVTSIGYSVFSGCSGLTSIIVENGNTKYDSRDNCNAIIETSTNTLIAGCKNTVIPDSVTSIGGYAFYNCSGLTSITIPNSVTSIGDYAFSYGGLTNITIPNSVKSIGQNAFSDCASLSGKIIIPQSVTRLSYLIFSNTNVSEIQFESPTGWFSYEPWNGESTATSFDFSATDFSANADYLKGYIWVWFKNN